MSAAAPSIERERIPAPRQPRLSFAGSVGAEARKVLGQRSTVAILGVGVLLFVGVMLLLTLSSNGSVAVRQAPAAYFAEWQDILFTVFTMGAGIVLLLTTARLVGMEYSMGTIRILLARGTGRVQLLLAKLIVLALLGVVLLAVFTVASLIWTGAAVLHWTGSLTALTSLPASTLHDLGLGLVMSLISIGFAILIGGATATLGRSVAFGVGVAMVLFPADNFGTVILGLISRLTHQQFWMDISAYLLGPNLNHLPTLWISDRKVLSALTPPLMKVDLMHTLLTIGIWALGLLVLQLVLTWRRDVLA